MTTSSAISSDKLFSLERETYIFNMSIDLTYKIKANLKSSERDSNLYIILIASAHIIISSSTI